MTHIENDENFFDNFNVSDTSLILSSPMWASDYSFAVKCSHPNLGLLNCGSWTVEAVVGSNPDCFAHTPACRLPDRGEIWLNQKLTPKESLINDDTQI